MISRGNGIPISFPLLKFSSIGRGYEGNYFFKEAQALDRVLTEYGIEHELYNRDETYDKLQHGREEGYDDL